MQPDVEPLVHVRDQPARGERADHEHEEAEQQPGGPGGRDVQHRDEQPHEHRAGADVALEDEQQQAGRPGHQDRTEVAGPRQVDAEHAPASQGQHVPLGHQVAGEGGGQRQFGELLRLDRGERAEPDLDLGAVHLADRRREQRGQCHQQDPGRTEGIGVTLQHAGLADQDEHGDEAPDADGGEGDLQVGLRGADRGMPGGRVHLRRQAVHHHDGQAVQQGREREQQRVSPRGEPPHGQVGHQDDGQVDGQVDGRPRGQLALERETDVRQRERDQGEGEHQHDQLGAPPAARRRGQRTRRVNSRRRCGDAAHEAPGDGTRASAEMPKAVGGWHIGGLAGCGPGPWMALMSLAGLWFFLARATLAW